MTKKVRALILAPQAQGAEKKLQGHCWYFEYFFKSIFPIVFSGLLSLFVAWIIFNAQKMNEEKRDHENQVVFLKTLDGELAISIDIAQDLRNRIPFIINEVDEKGQRFFTSETIEKMQGLSCGELSKYFADLKDDNRSQNYLNLIRLKTALELLHEKSTSERKVWLVAVNNLDTRCEQYIESATILRKNIRPLI